MKIGNLVTFNRLPDRNTPGAPSSAQPGVGTVINVLRAPTWCEVMWPTGEVTKCFRKDLFVLERVK